MKNLNMYISRTNKWNAIFGKKPLVLPLDALRIHGRLEVEMSPENISCDGEADPKHVAKQLKFLSAAKAELEANYGDYLLVD